jgi:hypothetical protein
VSALPFANSGLTAPRRSARRGGDRKSSCQIGDLTANVVLVLPVCGQAFAVGFMNFKRKRPKNARAGCLLCKPHKANGACPAHKDMRFGNRRRYESGREQLRCASATSNAPLTLAD